MQQQRLQPDVIAYRALISACESGASVTAVFDYMQQQRVQANVITYNSLIRACEKGKDSKRALGVFVLPCSSGEFTMFTRYFA